MEDILRQVKISDIRKMVVISGPLAPAFLKGKGVERFFYKHIPARSFEELKIPLKIVATDFWRRKEVVFESGALIPAIRSSISIPGLLKPVKIGDTVLVDGGAVNPVPYDTIRQECDILIAINVTGSKTPLRKDSMPSFMESVMLTSQIMQATIMEHKLRISRPDIYIKPKLKDIGVLEFYRYADIINDVKNDVQQFKDEISRWMKRRFPFF
jgi:NTE family protein